MCEGAGGGRGEGLWAAGGVGFCEFEEGCCVWGFGGWGGCIGGAGGEDVVEGWCDKGEGCEGCGCEADLGGCEGEVGG